ncbi:hypothetical protein SRABI04_02192 [Chryseobacterium sp. Bi04]|nr:hypothetical protein SRABI04_02192 [Chryseobacterium sp. Bi04]
MKNKYSKKVNTAKKPLFYFLSVHYLAFKTLFFTYSAIYFENRTSIEFSLKIRNFVGLNFSGEDILFNCIF